MPAHLDILIFQLIALLLAIPLIYYSFILLKKLNNPDLVASMIFLHEKKVETIFLVLTIGSFLFFLGHVFNAILQISIIQGPIINLIGLIYSFILLYFVYSLNTILPREEAYGHQ